MGKKHVFLMACILTVAGVESRHAAIALTLEEARRQCIETIGTPIVRACMQEMGAFGPGSEANRDTIRAKCITTRSSTKVAACMSAALNKANGRANVPIEIGTRKEAVNLDRALPAGFVPPPRSITDIAAVIDNEKPDPAVLAKLKADTDNEPRSGLSVSDLAEFFYNRANARSTLGRDAEAVADANKGFQIARSGADIELREQLRKLLGFLQRQAGDLKGSIATFGQQIRETENALGLLGHPFSARRNIIESLLLTGDIPQAEAQLRGLQSLIVKMRTTGMPRTRAYYADYGRTWEANFDAGRALLFEARGNYRDAEIAYQRAANFHKAWIVDTKRLRYPPAESLILQWIDADLLNVARMKARQGRLAEAEADARAVLLSRLKAQGKYNTLTTRYVMGLAGILMEQGRTADAERLVRSALDIQRTVGVRNGNQYSAQIISQLGSVLTLQGKTEEAAQVYDDLDKAIEKWEPIRRRVLELNGSRITALYASGKIDAGIAAAQEALKYEIARVGERHFDAAVARGTLAVGYSLARRDTDAIREFKAAIPILTAAQRENTDQEDDTANATRSQRLQAIVETYIGLLAKSGDGTTDQTSRETFALADAIRGQSVQKALSASSARSVANDPALADLVRREQDLGKQINSQLGALNNALASNTRDENVVKATKATIDQLRGDRQKVRQDIDKRFPNYAELIDPKPPAVDQIKDAMAPGEAMLSYYFSRTGGFVWAVPKEGTVTFAAINASAGDIENMVRRLREALEPNASMVSDIPVFDLTVGYELYKLLLQPVESGWKQAKNLIVVTNGALGQLPLSLLPTSPAQVNANEVLLFESYRKVAWLGRTHAVTMLPSSAALRTIRNLPPGKPGRGELIGFGDPYFSKEQYEEAVKEVQVANAGPHAIAVRGIPLRRRNLPKLDGVDSAELGLLPRLPDTAEELKSIALALKADPSKALHLGKDATERAVKAMPLADFKILAFATHGLVPGELNGLTQPALALSSPSVTGDDGDGLLTMEEILSLKLDADWVVLSACNTGAGAGAGAEAASGLGRAFFYAGTRSLLITNWSVHSQSARALVTDVFKRRAADPNIGRSEALRQAMMALLDKAVYLGSDGKAEFAYAHPLFWAPYSIIGDGGSQ